MAQTHRNRWKSRRSGPPPGVSAKSVYWGRAIFTSLAVLLVAVLLIFIFWPHVKPGVRLIVVTGPQLNEQDEVALPLPRSIKGIPAPEHDGNVVGVDQVEAAINGLKMIERNMIEKDTLFVYVMAEAVIDPQLGPCLVRSLPRDSMPVAVKDEANEHESDSAPHLEPVEKFLRSVLEASRPVGTVVVTFDCSRTLRTPRWGWMTSGGFSQEELKPRVEAIGSQRLWVISASGENTAGELGIQQGERSFSSAFQAARAELLEELKSKDSRVTVREFFSRLCIKTKNFSQDRMNPCLVTAIQQDADSAEAVAWYPPDDFQPRKAKTETKAEPERQELSAQNVSAGAKNGDDAAPVIPRHLADLWALCDELEAFKQTPTDEKNSTDVGNKDAVPPADEPQQARPLAELKHPERSPLMFAPHLWRRLKAELVALEFQALASKDSDDIPNDEAYASALKSLRSEWDKRGRGGLSEEVFDYIHKVGDEYKQGPVEADELTDACLAYAEALYVAVELIQLEDRLASVANADSFSLEKMEPYFENGKKLLKTFYDTAFPDGSTETVEAKVIDELKQVGKDLRRWTRSALTAWTVFGNGQIKETSGAARHAVGWVTLDVLLTSGIWPAETRRKWRAAQSHWDGQNPGQQPRRKDVTPIPESRLADLTSIIDPADKVDELRTWLSRLPARVKAAPERQRHFLATLCDQRDWNLGLQPIRLGRTIRKAPVPETIWLELPKVTTTEPTAAKEGEKPALELEETEYDLDRHDMVEVRVNVLRKRGDADLTTRDVKLKAIPSPGWLALDEGETAEKTVRFGSAGTDAIEQTVSWRVKMTDQKERQTSQERATQPLTVQFTDEKSTQWRADPDKSIVTEQIIVRNHRAVLLTGESIDSPRDPERQEDHVYRIGLPASQNYHQATKWALKNYSPVEVTVDVKLFSIPSGPASRATEVDKDWHWAWGTVPTKAKSRKPLWEWYQDRGGQETAVASAKVSLKDDEAKTIDWKLAAPQEVAGTAKEPGARHVTHGLCCVMTIDNDPPTVSWIEMLPVSPKEELLEQKANLNATVVPSEERIAKFRPPEELDKYTNLGWRVETPRGWSSVRPETFEMRQNGDDFRVFVDMQGWPRALYWKVSEGIETEPKVQELKTGKLRWLMLQGVSYLEDKLVIYPQIPPVWTLDDTVHNRPWPQNHREPLVFKYSKSDRFTVSLEADATTRDFNRTNDQCAELRLEEMVDSKGLPLFLRRADRDWSTTCTVPPDRPGTLQFMSAVSDFKISLKARSGLLKLRASIHLPNQSDQSDAEDTVRLFFDGQPPKVSQPEVVDTREKSADGKIKVNLTWSDDGSQCEKGVEKIDFWISKTRVPTQESFVHSHAAGGVDGDGEAIVLNTAAIDEKDRTSKTYYVIARATDYSGRSSTDSVSKEFLLPLIREPAPPSPGKPQEKPEKKMDGEIRGQLVTPNGNPTKDKKFPVRLMGGNVEQETETKRDGTFVFRKLDREVDYSISVDFRVYTSSSTLGQPGYKVGKPKDPGSPATRIPLVEKK